MVFYSYSTTNDCAPDIILWNAFVPKMFSHFVSAYANSEVMPMATFMNSYYFCYCLCWSRVHEIYHSLIYVLISQEKDSLITKYEYRAFVCYTVQCSDLRNLN